MCGSVGRGVREVEADAQGETFKRESSSRSQQRSRPLHSNPFPLAGLPPSLPVLAPGVAHSQRKKDQLLAAPRGKV